MCLCVCVCVCVCVCTRTHATISVSIDIGAVGKMWKNTVFFKVRAPKPNGGQSGTCERLTLKWRLLGPWIDINFLQVRECCRKCWFCMIFFRQLVQKVSSKSQYIVGEFDSQLERPKIARRVWHEPTVFLACFAPGSTTFDSVWVNQVESKCLFRHLFSLARPVLNPREAVSRRSLC